MPRVPVNGVSLKVEVVGEGPPVVGLHGFTGDMSIWDCFKQAVCREFTLVLVDLLGHGGSDAPYDSTRYSMDRCVGDLLGVLNSLEIQRASWIGYSMGGRICLYLALTAPERCHALVLEGVSPGISDTDERRRRIDSDAGLARLIEEKGVAAFVEYWESLPMFESQGRLPGKVRQGLRSQRLRNNPLGLANSLRGLGSGVQPPLDERLPYLDLPVFFVVGEEDSKFCQIAQSMDRAVPQGRVALIPEAGHAAHLEQPDDFNRIVMNFLRAHKGD